MARYDGQFDETFTVKAPPDVVLAQFLDLDQIVAHYGELDEHEHLGDGTLRFLLTEQNHGVFRFQGRYACQYRAAGDDGAEWNDVGDGGNIWTKGHLKVSPGAEPGTTKLRYVAEMSLEIDVNPVLAGVLKPVVSATIPHQMKAYVKRMISAAESR